MNKDFKVLMLASGGVSSRIMYNALKNKFDIVKVIIEDPVSKKVLLKNRIRRLGYMKVLGQLIFMVFNRFMIKISKNRISEIKRDHHLNTDEIPDDLTVKVKNINNDEVINVLHKYKPDAIIVNGTRIISDKILSSTESYFINTHVGITPKYRGVHGGYWALASNDKENCGVTVHLVDKGIDTGGVISQDIIITNKKDTFNTYPYHQIAKSIPLMKQALYDIQHDTLKTKEIKLPSILWYHPTLLEYIINYFKLGVK